MRKISEISQLFYRRKAEKTVEALKKNRIEAHYVDDEASAIETILKEIPADASSVGIGGSVTIREIGLIPILEEKTDLEIIHHWKPEYGHSPEGIRIDTWYPGIDADIRRATLTTDVFMSSVNALTYDGKIVIIDGNGNRSAATVFGPKKSLFITGVNKLVPDLESALYRIKHIAAPMSAYKGNLQAPCVATGECSDCSSPQRGCNVTTIIEKRPKLTEMTVVIIGKSLGY